MQWEAFGCGQRIFRMQSAALVQCTSAADQKMAGAAVFEPTHGRIKTCCLTAWRRPCIDRDECWALSFLMVKRMSNGGRCYVRCQSAEALCRNGRKFTNFCAMLEAKSGNNFVLKQLLIVFAGLQRRLGSFDQAAGQIGFSPWPPSP